MDIRTHTCQHARACIYKHGQPQTDRNTDHSTRTWMLRNRTIYIYIYMRRHVTSTGIWLIPTGVPTAPSRPLLLLLTKFTTSSTHASTPPEEKTREEREQRKKQRSLCLSLSLSLGLSSYHLYVHHTQRELSFPVQRRFFGKKEES